MFLTIFTQIPLNRFMKVSPFMEFSVDGKKIVQKYSLQVMRHFFICIAAVKLLQFLTFISKHCVFKKFFSQIPSLTRYEKIKNFS